MKKTVKKNKSKKKHFYLFGGKYEKSPEKHKVAKILTTIIISVAVAAAGAGILVADHNSRTMGWGDNRTELAFAVSSDSLDITVMGQEYVIDTAPVRQAGDVYAQLCRGLDYLKPVPIRFLDMLYICIKNKISSMV